ncbi:MAG: phospholipase D-like domain-containing protein [Deltaproteobacteria bacterium]|jgi:phosphatidylserine/phosphatidylglycerophosphate/cardiolipin synthase-like enzyme|nr:phospholipase D-like domain-containing protein [Deltaproteobacteria bacterium]MCL5880399.1 phospholipase D-like domain-containing protein [Deltaproteobacteria bacterium]MDA8303673.1 phospholipase D-like domain-containing protein [Deltaproteobacteria bacterium]
MKIKKLFIIVLILQLFISIQLIASKTSAAYSATYYSPQSNLQRIDIHWLKKALRVKRLYIAMYSFTDKTIARELLYLAGRGVSIYIYRDDKQIRDRTDVTRMLENVRNMHIKAKDDKGFWNIMHDKIFIIPGVVFREGSANWSPSAEGASCWNGNCGSSQNQDNNATYITDRAEINGAIRVFWRMWNRRNNLIYTK